MPLETTMVADIRVPRELSRLRDLAYNLWWSWTPRARFLFSSIDGPLWASYRNPVQLLINIEPHHWNRLLEDGVFLSMYRRVIRDFDRYMDPESETWFKGRYPDYQGGPVAYFSTEFGLHESLGIYCGGLGVLSGDHAKAASDMGLPFVGVSLLYRQGYFKQAVDTDGRQHHIFSEFDFHRLPLRPLHDAAGRELVVTVDLPGRTVNIKVWRLTVGRVQLYLLDTDLPTNDPADRPITAQLYVRGREMRLCQEVILGIGGVRALRALRIAPAAWHMNEGHSALQVAERVREHMAEGSKLGEAVDRIAACTSFTTHTPVSAGNEVFDANLMMPYLQFFSGKTDLPVESLMAMGSAYPDGGKKHPDFNLTALALRFASFRNGVSKLHGEVADGMWHHLFKDGAEGKGRRCIGHVTNGVHIATWLGHDLRTLFEERLDPDWSKHQCDPACWDRLRQIPDDELWEAHQAQKDRLVRMVRHRMQEQYARNGESPGTLRAVARQMDPHALTIGFARRFATYKRAGLIFRDFDRLRRILTNPDRPVQIVFSGKAHPADGPGQELVQHIVQVASLSELRNHIFFVEDYEMRIARHLVQGADVWMNTPRRTREASGTSGMKAALNGAVNFSIADGWWGEAVNGRNGWTIGNGEFIENDELQDMRDADSLYELLENEIVPLFYEERNGGVAPRWVALMKESMASIIPAFCAQRMLKEYVEQAYMPAMSR